MPTDAEQLATIKSQVLAVLVEITAQPKPTYDIDGQHVLWAEYYKMLMEQLAELDALIAAAGGPFEIHSQGYT